MSQITTNVIILLTQITTKGDDYVSISVRIDKDLFESATREGKAQFRSGAQQINFWAKVGKNALANPDLPVDYVAQLLIAKDMPDEPFEFESEPEK